MVKIHRFFRCFIALFLISAAGLMLSACKTTGDYPPNSIGGNTKIPTELFTEFYGEEVENAFLGRKYDAYVRFRGVTNHNGELQVSKVLKAYPAKVDMERIEAFANGLKNNYKAAGSHVNPALKVHVLCYEKGMFPYEAIVLVEPAGISTPETSIYSKWIRIIQYSGTVVIERSSAEETN